LHKIEKQRFAIRIVNNADLEYEEESMDGEGAAGGSGGTRQCYTLGRANLEHSPKPSQIINIQLTSSTFLKRKKYTVNITVFLTLWKTQVPTNKPKK